MRKRSLILAAAGVLTGCAGGAVPADPADEGALPGTAGAERPDLPPEPRVPRPPPRWWTRGSDACPDGGDLERRERGEGRVLTCKTGSFPHGPQVAWYDSGVREWERTYLDGELHGVWVRWYPSGQKRSEIEYLSGERDGLAQLWDKEGQILSRSRWRDGQLRERTEYKKGQIERTVTYHESGQRAGEQAYADGARHGVATTWHPSGVVASRGTYRKGKKHGVWIYADESGRTVRTEEYDDGELISRREGGDLEDAVAPFLTGVTECDELIRTVLACDRLTEANRTSFKSAAESWRAQLKEGTGSEESVRKGCIKIDTTWQQTLQSAGCR